MTNVDLLFDKIDSGRLGKNIGLKTGIDKFDEYTGGIQRGIYTLFFGLSGSGKSSVVLYMIYRTLKDNPDKDIKYVYFSLELSCELLLAKLMCLYIYEEFGVVIPYTDLMSWQEVLSDEKYQYVEKSKAWLSEISEKLLIFDKSLTAKSFYRTLMTLLEEWGTFTTSEDGRRKIYTKHNPEQYVIAVVDHIGLCLPEPGNTKKQEIDLISQYAVNLRERCQVSFFVLQQENRNSANMDRRKMDMTECSAEDLKESGNCLNDCELCIGVYYPLKHKLKTHRGYPIICDSSADFKGLRDRYRSLVIVKSRLGVSDRLIPVNFFGEIGYFKQFKDKPENITDWKPYLSLETKDSETEDVPENKSQEPLNSFNFKF